MRKNINISMKFGFNGIDVSDRCHPHLEGFLAEVFQGEFMEFRLALGEALVNALQHGKKGMDETEVILSVRYKNKILFVDVWSNSDGFDVKKHFSELKSMEKDWQDRLKHESHGRGIWMMLMGCDRVIYLDGGRRVILAVNVEKMRCKQGLLQKVRFC